MLLAASSAVGRRLWQTKTPGHSRNAEAALTLLDRMVLVPLAWPGGVAA